MVCDTGTLLCTFHCMPHAASGLQRRPRRAREKTVGDGASACSSVHAGRRFCCHTGSMAGPAQDVALCCLLASAQSSTPVYAGAASLHCFNTPRLYPRPYPPHPPYRRTAKPSLPHALRPASPFHALSTRTRPPTAHLTLAPRSHPTSTRSPPSLACIIAHRASTCAEQSNIPSAAAQYPDRA